MAAAEEDNSVVVVPDMEAGVPGASMDNLAAAAAVVGLPAADSPDNKEAATPSTEVASADTEDVCQEGRAIYNSRNLIPTTSLRLVESIPIDNNCKTNCLP